MWKGERWNWLGPSDYLLSPLVGRHFAWNRTKVHLTENNSNLLTYNNILHDCLLQKLTWFAYIVERLIFPVDFLCCYNILRLDCFAKQEIFSALNPRKKNKESIKSISISAKRAGGWGGCSPYPSVLKIFEQNACDLGKSTWDKLFIEYGFYNTTKRSILKSFNGSAVNLPIASNCWQYGQDYKYIWTAPREEKNVFF